MAERIIEAWEERQPRLEPLCRMLLVADRFGVALLRDHCLHCLAARFEALAEERVPPREREVFEAFVAAVAQQVPVLACPPGSPDMLLLPWLLQGPPGLRHALDLCSAEP